MTSRLPRPPGPVASASAAPPRLGDLRPPLAVQALAHLEPEARPAATASGMRTSAAVTADDERQPDPERCRVRHGPATGAVGFSATRLPSASRSIRVRRKVATASSGLQADGLVPSLNDVFSTTGTPVSRSKAEMRAW